jgi:hypothetical protein
MRQVCYSSDENSNIRVAHAMIPRSFLREFEFICEKASEPQSGGPWPDILMKKPRVENRVTLSLQKDTRRKLKFNRT